MLNISTECLAVFDQKQHGPLAHLPYSPNLNHSDFLFVSPDEKILKGKSFAIVEEVKQKKSETLKGIKSDAFKNCFEQLKKYLDRCIAVHYKRHS